MMALTNEGPLHRVMIIADERVSHGPIHSAGRLTRSCRI